MKVHDNQKKQYFFSSKNADFAEKNFSFKFQNSIYINCFAAKFTPSQNFVKSKTHAYEMI